MTSGNLVPPCIRLQVSFALWLSLNGIFSMPSRVRLCWLELVQQRFRRVVGKISIPGCPGPYRAIAYADMWAAISRAFTPTLNT